MSDMVSAARELVSQGMSVNLYMFHGGSSFGFMTGALGEPIYKALVPSYGGCPLSCTLSEVLMPLDLLNTDRLKEDD